jgi:YfiH family protein
MSSAAFPRVRSDRFAQLRSLVVCMSTRQGADAAAPFGFNLGFDLGDDDARVEAALHAFLESNEISPDEVAFMDQVHGAHVSDATEPGVYAATDAVVTNRQRLALAVRVADCTPVLLAAPADGVIAAVHAGWRGLAEGIVASTVAHMHARYGTVPGGILAYAAPGARACCYEVGDDVARRFPEACIVRESSGHIRLDLAAAARTQLLEAGVPGDAIEVDPLCTIHHETLFHSHRRDRDRAGRMLAVIALREEG